MYVAGHARVIRLGCRTNMFREVYSNVCYSLQHTKVQTHVPPAAACCYRISHSLATGSSTDLILDRLGLSIKHNVKANERVGGECIKERKENKSILVLSCIVDQHFLKSG